jgi:hypothetical protein
MIFLLFTIFYCNIYVISTQIQKASEQEMPKIASNTSGKETKSTTSVRSVSEEVSIDVE